MSEYAAIVAFAFGLSGGIVFGFLLGVLYPAARAPGSNPMWRGPKPPPPPSPPRGGYTR